MLKLFKNVFTTIGCFVLFLFIGTQKSNAQNTLTTLGLTATTPAASAYSLRKLSSNYTGFAIQVRRSNDNNTQNIGFTAGGDLDTAALKTFVGNNNGFVTIWYDQSSNARNLSQATTSKQPAIVNGGVIYRKNDKPTVFFDGTDDGMLFSGTDYLTANGFSVNLVAGSNAASNLGRRALQGKVGVNWLIGPYTNAHTWFAGDFNHVQAIPWSTTQVERFTVIQANGSANTSFRNGSSITSANNKTEIPGKLFLGTEGTFAEPLDGFISEVVSYASELNTTDRQSMETSQAAYYALSTNANLTTLATTPTTTFNTSFAANTIAYTTNVANATSSITVTPTKEDANATIEVRINNGTYTTVASGNASSNLNLNVGANIIDVKVTAQNGTTIKTYTITVTRASAPLSTLNITNNTATNAYSTRKLTTTYTGFALQVRRSSDNATQDIGFTTSGDLDTTALKTFVGNNSGFVSIWYDQSGNGNNATNTNNATQPSIVLNGVVNRLAANGNKPTITAATATNALSFAVSPNITGNGLTTNVVASMQGATPAFGRLVSLSNGNTSNDFDNNLYTSAIIRNNTNNQVLLYRNFIALSAVPIALNAGTVITSTINGTVGEIYANNELFQATFSAPSNNFGISFGRIFNHTNDGDATTGWVGSASEVVLFATLLNTTDRQSMEASQTNYYLTASCTPTASTFTVAACGTYTWAAKGNKLYTASNTTDTIMLKNAAGCDSIVTLNLTIKNSTNNVTTQTAMLTYTWATNGTTYTTSGTYIYSYTNGIGCASADTLKLTITTAATPITYSYTGAMQTYIVPAGVNKVNVKLKGASGGNSTWGNAIGGKGAYVQGDFAVTPGTVINIFVGGQTGWNGGGAAGVGTNLSTSKTTTTGGRGGDASDIRIGGTATSNRVMVAGGGGGAGGGGQSTSNVLSGDGGNGGNSDTAGTAGANFNFGGSAGVTLGGKGGTVGAGGLPGTGCVSEPGVSGTAGSNTGTGGNGCNLSNTVPRNPSGGGGGGGYVTGGGGGGGTAGTNLCIFNDNNAGGGGAGGSNYTGSATNVSIANGDNTGNGIIEITPIFCTPTASTFTVAACGTYTWAAKGNKQYTASNTTDTIMLTNAVGCDSIVTLNLTINAAPTLSIATSGATTFCAGDSVTLTANLNAGTNNALQLNGSNYAKANPIAALNLTNNLSIEAWIKPSFDGVHYIVSKGISDFSSGHYGLLQLNNKIQFTLGGAANVVSTANITPGVYTHVAATYDGANMKLYINGVLDNSTAYNQSLIPNTDTLQIGRLGNPIAMYNFNGEIDELRIWNTAKTATEINNNKNAILPAATAGLAAYYRFSETTGTTTADASSNGNTATLVNAPSFVSNTTALQPQATYTWLPGGAITKAIVAKANNTYKVTTNFNGCTATDSVVVKVNQPTTSTFTVAACGTYTWVAKGNKVYTASNNTDTIMLKNAAGCDSIVTLNLTITNCPLTTLNITNNSATNAYSTRKLTTTYTGFALQVRRSSDNATQNIGFTTAGDLDTTSLKSFIGSNSGFVTIWYDQSGNGNNATNTNTATQPSIVVNGVVNRLAANGNKPTITAATATNALSFAVIPAITGNGLTANAVATMQGATPAFGRLVSLSNGSTTNDFNNNLYTSAIIRNNADNQVMLYRNFNTLSRAAIALNAGTVITSTINGADYSIYANNMFLAGSLFPALNTNLGISFGRIFNHTNNGDATTGWVGSASEVLLFATPLNTTDRQSMEASQVSYHINASCSPTASTFTVAACGPYTWAAKGNKLYTASNTTDTIMLVNAAGCDSIVTLNLTLTPAPNATTTTTAYGSYTWLKNNTTYTSSGNYTTSYTNGGCTIVDTLKLTINPFTGCFKQVSAGSSHSVAIKLDGTLWAWGNGGLLGDGTTNASTIPIQIGLANNWKTVSVGYVHNLALKTDGTLWAWGNNSDGQLGDGSTTNKLIPTQIGTDNNWTTIVAGTYQTFAIKSNGTLWAWGYNINGYLGDGTTTQRNSPTQIGTAANWSRIAAGDRHTLALKTDGTLWAWGATFNGQLGDGSALNGSGGDKTTPIQIGSATNWASISAGAQHSLAIKTDGTLWAWGNNGNGALGNNGTFPVNTPIQIGSATNWASLSAGFSHSLAIKTDGTLWAWGDNSDGQLGDNSLIEKRIPTQIGNATNWAIVNSIYYHNIAIQTDGTTWVWGNNGNGNLGDGTNTQRRTPTSIACPVSSTTTVWNGTTWSNGTPTSTLDAIIASNTAPGSFTCKALTVNNGITLNVSNGSKVTVSSTTTNNGNIVVAPTGSFVSAAAVSNVTIQKNIIGQRGWRMFAYPFTTTQTFSSLATTNGIAISTTPSGASGLTDVRSFTNGTTNGWNNVTASSTTANTPFALFIRGLASEVTGLNYNAGPSAFTFSVNGTLNASPFSVTPSASNFTLVGNPFAAPVNSSALTNGTGKSYYVYQISQGGNLTAQRTKAGAWSTVLSSSATTPIPTLGVIAYQAGSATSYNITTANINTTNAATTGLFSTEKAIEHLELRVLQNGMQLDNLFVRQDAAATAAGTDGKDLQKLANEGLNVYTIASNDNTRLAVDTRNLVGTTTIPLGIVGAVGNYQLQVANLNIEGVNVSLKDAFTNTITALKANSNYEFAITTDAASKGENRFELVLNKAASNIAGVDILNAGKMTAKLLNGNINKSSVAQLEITGAAGKVEIRVTDMAGRLLHTQAGQNGRNTIQLGRKAGVQVITISDGTTTINQKMVKQ